MWENENEDGDDIDDNEDDFGASLKVWKYSMMKTVANPISISPMPMVISYVLSQWFARFCRDQ